ncbi:uncharacterized protein METZ01_LOCUS410645 [marine metagenome]|jgi:hypothetical protein|uniref:Uncharacterized protein n=1 Tax=marine metagenome TaxID=408172 RepID=A0A382WI81_9ZZZZ
MTGYISILELYKNSHTTKQAVDAPVEKCVLTITKRGERL